MKKIITTLAIALAVVAGADAQTKQSVTKPSPEAKLLGSEVVGSNLISRWLVLESSAGDRDFSIRYQINMAKMSTTFNGNSTELSRLKGFMNTLMQDDTKSITAVEICGYASPDGAESTNDKLAMARATNCRSYLVKQYPRLAGLSIKTKGVAQPWSATKSAIMDSSTPSKSAVLSTISTTTNEAMVEGNLRKDSASWEYIVENILPPMRRVEIEISYDNWVVVETITPVAVVGEVIVVEPDGDVEVVEIVEPLPPRYIVIDQYQPDVEILYNNYYAPIDFEDRYERRSIFKFRERRRREKIKYRY